MAVRAGQIADLYARVGLKTDDAKRGADELHGMLTGLVGAFTAAAGALAIGATVRAGYRELAQDVRLAAEESAGIASLGAAVRATGADWDAAEGAIERYLAAEARRIALDDGDGRAAIARMTEATGDYLTALDLMPLAADLARAKNMDLVNAAEILGKVAAGNTSILTRYGIVLDENATTEQAIAEMRRRFAGQAEAYAETALGQQERYNIALGNIKETIGGSVEPAVSGFYSLLATGAESALPLVESLAGAFSDLIGDWGRDLAGLAADAFNWGANIIDQFAAGIQGSGAVSGALRSIAADITEWLMPGSPPKLLPDLDDWGAGAAKAYFEGWASVAPAFGPMLDDVWKSLEPHLKSIDETGIFDRAKLAEAFGGQTVIVEGYVDAYAKLGEAIQETEKAQSEYDKAVEGGDEEAIKGAKGRLDVAKTAEDQARRRLAAEQQQMQARLRQEAMLAQAIGRQSDLIEERERREAEAAAKAAQREAEAEARRAAAEAKRIADAKLAWELASAAGPEEQIAIWQRELAAVTEGSAEYWQILTRIVQLEKSMAAEGAAAAGSAPYRAAGEAVAEGATEGTEEGLGKIDWGGIGGAIATALWQGIREKTDELMTQWAADLTTPENLAKASRTGRSLAHSIVQGIISLFRSPDEREATSGELADHVTSGSEALGAAFAQVAKTGFSSFRQSWNEEWVKVGGLWGLIFGGTDPLTRLAQETAAASQADIERAIAEGKTPTRDYEIPNAREWIQWFLGGGWREILGVGSYALGGVVPGPVGAPQLAIVHGGERIIPTNQTHNAVTVNVNVYGGDEAKGQRMVLSALRAAGVGVR